MGTWIKTKDSAGSCCDCQPVVCDTCIPTVSLVECQYRSASRSKCGFEEFTGYESIPPRIYQTKSISGSYNFKGWNTTDCTATVDVPHPFLEETHTFSGSCTYSNCVLVDSSSIRVVSSNDGVVFSDETSDGCATLSTSPVSATVSSGSAGGGCVPSGAGSQVETGSWSETLSNEFTNAVLEAECTAAVAAASWTGFGSCSFGATRLLSSDEVTLTLREMEYLVQFSGAVTSAAKLTYTIYLDGSPVGTGCVNLALSSTQQVVPLTWPAGFNGTYTLDGWSIVAGTC